LSGPREDSRTNVPEAVALWIVAGQTTRRDVLLGLGDPDGKAPDEHWFTYGSAISHGGIEGAAVGFGNAGSLGRESVEYRRLIVRFDDNGVVSSVDWQNKRCTEYPQGSDSTGYVTTVPCVDIQGNDLTSGAIAAADTTAAESLAQFDRVSWWTYPRGERPCADHYVSYHELPSIGRMEITRNSLMLVALPPQYQQADYSVIQHPAGRVTIPLSEIKSVIMKGRMIVEQKNGSCLYAEVFKGRFGAVMKVPSEKKMKAASELLQKAAAMAAANEGVPPPGPK
jgi:hypothetical protein